MQWLESWPEWVPRLTWTLGTVAVFYAPGQLTRAIVGSRLSRLARIARISDSCFAMSRRVTLATIVHASCASDSRGARSHRVPGALRSLHASSRGVPRLVNILAHKSLLLVYGEGARRAEGRHVRTAVEDTPSASARWWWWKAA